jgi:hypothetical protein
VVQLHENRTVIACDDGTIPKGGWIEKYQVAFDKAAELAGIKEVSQELEGYLVEAGFVDVKAVVKKLPIGPWPKDKKKKVSTKLPAVPARENRCPLSHANSLCESPPLDLSVLRCWPTTRRELAGYHSLLEAS